MSSHDGPPVVAMVAFVALYGLFILTAIGLSIFWIIELVDVARRQFADPNEKLIWVLIIALAHGIGAIVYWFVGRPKGWLPGELPKQA
jgi:hypothetical protein